MGLLDLARFAPTDPEPVVAAAFACPYCLERPTVSRLALDPEPVVLCICEPCDAEWEVALADDQALRMELAPPAGLWLEH